MDTFILDGKEKRDLEVKKFGNSAHIVVPKEYIGQMVKVVFPEVEEE